MPWPTEMRPPSDVMVEASVVRVSSNHDALLSDLQMVLRSGEIACVVGENGCGKTTLSYVLARFAPFLVLHGLVADLRYDGECTTRAAAERFWATLSYTFQDPDSQYSELRVNDELRRVVPPRAARQALLDKYAMRSLIHRPFADMSYGERQRVLWARDWACQRSVYFLDEVGSYLDLQWQSVLAEDLLQLRRDGRVVSLFGHPGPAISTVVDQWYTLRDGRLLPGRPAQTEKAEPVRANIPRGEVILSVEEFRTGCRRRPIRCPVPFEVRRGDIVCLEGKNGSGKTTLLMAICGLLGQRPRGIRYPASVSSPPVLVMQNPYAQTLQDRIGSMLQRVDVERLDAGFAWLRTIDKDRDPLSLSYGEQKAIHVLDALASESPLVLIDELTTGLSGRMLGLLCREIVRACERGKSLIVSCHPGCVLPLPVTTRVSLCEGLSNSN